MTGGCRCAIAACSSQQTKTKNDTGQNLSFFRFPKDLKIRKEWIRRCYRKDKFNPDTSRICKLHFKDNDFEINFKSQLLNMPDKPILKSEGKIFTQFSATFLIIVTCEVAD